MVYERREPENRIISNLPVTGKAFIKEMSGENDQEVFATWLLTWTVRQMKGARQLIEQKFLPDEINLLKDIIKEDGYTPAHPPTAEALAYTIRRDKLLSGQVSSLSSQEILYLTLEQFSDEMQEDKVFTREYLTVKEFADAINPPRSKERIALLCKQGRVPGAFKSPYDGIWRIPASSLKPVQEEMNPRREKAYKERGQLV